MQFEDFITRVQEQAGLNTREEAILLTRAVLETLGERLDRKVRNGVEAQLPNELKKFLLAREEHNDAVERTRQVFSVFRQAVPGGEIEDILEDLPNEYRELFA